MVLFSLQIVLFSSQIGFGLYGDRFRLEKGEHSLEPNCNCSAVIDMRFISDQSPNNCNQSRIIRPLVTYRSQQNVSLSPYLQLTVADKLPIDC